MFPSTISLFFPLLFLLDLSSPAEAQSDVLRYHQCDPGSTFTAKSTYQSNLEQLLSTLASNGSVSGFFQEAEGQVPDLVYGLVLCRGDLNATACRSCLDTAILDAQQLCAYNKAASVWYDTCFLRFSNQRSILSTTDFSPMVYLWNPNNATQLDRFNHLLDLLLNSTADLSANSSNRFATAEVSNYTSEFPTIYGLMQCRPDMSVSECGQCLRGMFEPAIPDALKGMRGGRVMLGISCTLRYETSSFYQGSPTLKITSPLPAKNTTEPPAATGGAASPSVHGGDEGKENITRTVLAVGIPVGTMILISIIICICCLGRWKSTPDYETKRKNTTNFESIQFDLSTLRVATANFSEMNKLGEGGFGSVYKGLLPNGQEIAVKRLLNFRQGLGELRNELVLVSKLQHRNLVRLLGVCLEEEKMIVYEYVHNRSLDTFLFDPMKSGLLHWGTRYKIIHGIARGLLYLHEESQLRIIHRDLKCSNVLLDTYLNPKISDFGLAKLFDSDQSHATTNRVMGTFGYMAPEYAMQGKFSIKSDVFSFGVVVLEILTGRRINANYDLEVGEDLLSYTWQNWNRGTPMEIIDPALGGRYQGSNVLRCIQIGLLCVQENPFDRPTMRMVDLMLNTETISIQPPSRPAFYIGMSGLVQNSLSNASYVQVAAQERGMSPNEVSISGLGPR